MLVEHLSSAFFLIFTQCLFFTHLSIQPFSFQHSSVSFCLSLKQTKSHRFGHCSTSTNPLKGFEKHETRFLPLRNQIYTHESFNHLNVDVIMLYGTDSKYSTCLCVRKGVSVD